MKSPNLLHITKFFWLNFVNTSNSANYGAITSGSQKRYFFNKTDKKCRRALVDVTPEVDPACPEPCERRKLKKTGILHKIKLKVIEGGTNFGTPFRRIKCEPPVCKGEVIKTPMLPEVVRKVTPMPQPRRGVQVSVLGADSTVGQYVALLLKQCPFIKKLRLYEARDSECNRDLGKVAEDLHHINTNCLVQAFSCACFELERCLQNTDIVLMLESGINLDMCFEKRFSHQAPIVKHYTDVIAHECPKAFIIVAATPIDCMVPLVAETLKETGWYDPRKVLGSLAVPEMRASTLAARALCLEPRYTRIPCVGGTEGESLVPLFSKAVDYFDFTRCNAEMLTNAVRTAPAAVARCDGPCMRAADLSEAHALAGLVAKVSYALVCQDVPRVTGFVETSHDSNVISPARYLSVEVLLNNNGICKKFDFPPMNCYERELMDVAFQNIYDNVKLAKTWHAAVMEEECLKCKMQMQKVWLKPKHYDHLDECAVHLT